MYNDSASKETVRSEFISIEIGLEQMQSDSKIILIHLNGTF